MFGQVNHLQNRQSLERSGEKIDDQVIIKIFFALYSHLRPWLDYHESVILPKTSLKADSDNQMNVSRLMVYLGVEAVSSVTQHIA